MSKTRGFKFISKEQFEKDFKDFPEVKYEDLKKPKRGTAKSAGYDCFLPLKELKLAPEEEIKIPTGIRAYMQDDEVLFALPRSGQGFKYFIRLANTVGTIDSDYYEADNEGHVWIKIRNEGNKEFELKQNDAFCQLMFQKYLLADNDDFVGEKRIGGFGSTDKR